MKILWSSWCPSLFWVLDDSGILNQWDLTVNMFGPVRRVEDGRRGGSTTVVRVLFSVLLFFFFVSFFLFWFLLQAVFAGDGEEAEKTFSHRFLFFCCFFAVLLRLLHHRWMWCYVEIVQEPRSCRCMMMVTCPCGSWMREQCEVLQRKRFQC